MKKLILSLCLLLSMSAIADEGADTLEFKSDEQRSQYQRLTEELRCPKCQNQNIADSNAPIAKDLRNEVHRMILEGDNEEQIVDFMVERYGNFVVYKPKFDTTTYLLWLGPACIAMLGLVIVVISARKKRRASDTEGSALSQEEKNQLSNILSEDEK
ncbi:cytochrome c-type biogenesis protein [Alkalimarinus coralli]|uniref:cytochrome c-type biogenesis protein n=1 Tax=Alkalimarinus coralli TaxID=2935863 RepID=UPI00202B29C1|nr:cytochrome c-type biogenesis protein [Alkalimarinus coralli]